MANVVSKVVTLSTAQSVISTDTNAIPADGTTACVVNVTIKNTDQTDGEPNGMEGLAASNVVLSVTPSTGVTITQPTGNANRGGTVSGSFVSTNAATVSVGATVLGAAVTGNATVIVGGGDPPPTPPGDPFFEDDFAGGVRNNANGFTWNATGARVSVQLAPDASGDYALRFRFGPDADGADSTAEQRFNMGRNLSEVWIEYYLWVPANYVHRAQASSTNNKFFRLWGDSYTAANKIGASMFRDTAYSSDSEILGERNANFAPGTMAAQQSPSIEFGGADMLDTWTRVRLHCRYTDELTENGLINIEFHNAGGTRTLTFENSTLDQYYLASAPYWNNGYFFGWANSGYTDETDFYIRGGTNGVKFYDTDPSW